MLGMSKDTLRYYDRIGIVSPYRKDNRYRIYSKDDLIDLMNIQIMRYADFTLDEIKGKLGFRKMETIDTTYIEEAAAFLDAKNAETLKKIHHLEKVSQLLHMAAETLRDFNSESDQRLAEYVRELYQDIHENGPVLTMEECDPHQG